MPQVNITGNGQADETIRLNAINQLNQLDTKVLQRLAELSKSDKAKVYFQSDIKFALLKGYIK